ncbi:MAG: hypothetical protein ACTSPD_10445 [Promethearchaeota archaeon]
MQTLPANYYNLLDDKVRNPCARVYVQRNRDSIPFVGKSLTEGTNDELAPKHIVHSSGRFCVAWSEYNSTYSKYHVYYKYTDTGRTLWESKIPIITSNYYYNYDNPVIIELTDGSIGLVVSRNGSLYYAILTATGSITTGLTSMGIIGNTPTIERDGSNLILIYERSGTLYKRTGTSMTNWGSESSINTGLTNNHYAPYLHYDNGGKLWLGFERVSDPSASPEVINVYYITSTDNGSSWSSATQMTSFSAGEGSALRPSIVDTEGSYRYFAYTLERQIQNINTIADSKYGLTIDSVNDRILFAIYNKLYIYDESSKTYTSFDSTSNPDLISIRTFAYDETNRILVAGTLNNGIIVYDENTTTWSNFKTTTTPSIQNNRITRVAVRDKKVYYICGSSYLGQMGVIDLDAGTITTLSPNINVGSSIVYHAQIFFTSNAVVFICKSAYTIYSGNDWSYHIASFSLTGLTNLFYQQGIFPTSGGSYDTYKPYHSDTGNRGGDAGFDTSTGKLYSTARLVADDHDYGIAVFNITDSGVTFEEYWSNEAENIYGLLPNPDTLGGDYTTIVDMYVHPGNSRLYIQSNEAWGNIGGSIDHYVTVFNLTSKQAIEHYARTISTIYSSTFPEIDAQLIKVLQGASSYGWTYFDADDDKRLIFAGYNLAYWHILYTEGEDQRIYYKRTDDDSSWTSPVYLTDTLKDDNINLGHIGTQLIAFWDRPGSRVLKWDEDLSTEIDISNYVDSIQIDMTDENESNQAVITMSDRYAYFDIMNYGSLRSDYFEENNRIKIEMGYNGEYLPAFNGLIAKGSSVHRRGSKMEYRIRCFGKDKNWYKKKVTTTLFQNQTVSYIVEYIITTYGGLTVSEYDLPTISDIIPSVQFIDEYIYDMIFKLMQAYNYFPYFNEEGILIARKVIDASASIDFTYYQDGTDSVGANKAPAMNIESFESEWFDDELVNKVVVIGETPTTEETTFPEEFMGFIQGASGWFSKSQDFTFYFSEDKQLYCEEPRLDVKDSCSNDFFGGGESISSPGAGKQNYCTIHQNTSNQVSILYVLIAGALACAVLVGKAIVFNPLAFVVATAITILGQVGNFYYEIYAKPVGEPAPETIEATAEDAELIQQYGEIKKEIENPFLDTYEKCKALADNELQKAKWYRKKPVITIVQNMGHQVQDIIRAYNPHTGYSYKVYVREVHRSYTRGGQIMDELVCAWVE